MREIAESIVDLTGSSSKIEILGSGNEYTASGERLYGELKIKFTPFEKALRELTEYYKLNFSKLDLDSLE